MEKEERLALEVMEHANAFTGWNFETEKEGDAYYVGTRLIDNNGKEIFVYYLIGADRTQLTVFSPDCKLDYGVLQSKVNLLALKYPVYATGMGKRSIAINSPMETRVLKNRMDNIIMKRMTDMVQAMTDIINARRKMG